MVCRLADIVTLTNRSLSFVILFPVTVNLFLPILLMNIPFTSYNNSYRIYFFLRDYKYKCCPKCLHYSFNLLFLLDLSPSLSSPRSPHSPFHIRITERSISLISFSFPNQYLLQNRLFLVLTDSLAMEILILTFTMLLQLISPVIN